MKLTQLRMGLESLLGVRRRGIYVSRDYAESTHASEFEGYAALEEMFDARRDAFVELIDAIDSHAADLEAIRGLEPPEPRFEQDWFPRLDAAVYYTLIRLNRPARIIEIGSGHSTRFACRAVRDGGFECDITAIDPNPRADIARLPVTGIRKPVQEVSLDVFRELRAGDFLAVDSSHVMMPGTDVDFMINKAMPYLPSGVFVSFHDIHLPDAYPDEWPFGIYNEQNGVAPLLQGGYELVFGSAYAVSRMMPELERSVIGRLPLVSTAVENGLWMRKR